MSKIIRHEFMGSWLLFWFLCVSLIGIPLALLYLRVATLRIEDDLDDPEQFVAEFRQGKLAKGG
jgi:hypothetical protein